MDVRFLQLADQLTTTHYWGVLRFLGRLAPDTCMYAVDFKDDAPHLWHYHHQDELIVVSRGRIQQQIGLSPGNVTHDRILASGEAVHLPSGLWHSAIPLEPNTQVVFTIKGGDGAYWAYEANGQKLAGPTE